MHVLDDYMHDDLPRRKNLRLKNYDYSQDGLYFITICIKDRRNILWENVGAIINRPICPPLSRYGVVVETAINEIPNHYPGVSVDKYIIMPNHVHMILFVGNNDGECGDGRLIIAPTVSTIIKQMKRYVSKQIGFSMWQKSFYDHIIRDGEDYQNIWQYIDENPARWADDCYFSDK